MHYPSSSSLAQEPLYLQNDGRGKFQRLKFESQSYFTRRHRGRGLVAADLDGNGLLDLVFSANNEPAAILAQQGDVPGHWLGIELIGRRANRDAIGARVTLDTSRGKQLRTVVGGGSYLSQNPYTIHFGLPPGTSVKSAEITWPDGALQHVTQLRAGTIQRVLEPLK
jgi:hypothetical protein